MSSLLFNRRRVLSASLLLAAALPMVCGCNRGALNLAKVEGEVLLDGKPIHNVGVVFQPSDGPLATGFTDESGRFTLTTANRPGALVGEHRVTIAKPGGDDYQSGAGGTMGPPTTPGKSKRVPRLPPRYSKPDQTDLRATVEGGKLNTFKYSLESES